MDSIEREIREIRKEIRQAECAGVAASYAERQARRALLVREVEKMQNKNEHKPLGYLVEQILDTLRNEAIVATDEPLCGRRAIMDFVGIMDEETYRRLVKKGLPVFRVSEKKVGGLVFSTKGAILGWLRENAERCGIARITEVTPCKGEGKNREG